MNNFPPHFSDFGALYQARIFHAHHYYPFVIDQLQVGWIERHAIKHLSSWPEWFIQTNDAIILSPKLDNLESRSTVLANVVYELGLQGVIKGWRDELYAIKNEFNAQPLALIERAAARFFGLKTYSVHLNGIVKEADSLTFWIARRSLSKLTSPGSFDNIVAGGAAWPLSIEQTLAKEAWEEAGMTLEFSKKARYQNHIFLLRSLPQGVQNEEVFIYDIELPKDFSPMNQDGEVESFHHISVDQLIEWMKAGRFTMDATLAHYDCLRRHFWPELETDPFLLLKSPI